MSLTIFLKDEKCHTHIQEIKLPYPSAYPGEFLKHVREAFDYLYVGHVKYRQVGVILTELTTKRILQQRLFEDKEHSSTFKKTPGLYQAVDHINLKYGRTTLVPALSLPVTKEKPLKKGNSLRIPLLNLSLK